MNHEERTGTIRTQVGFAGGIAEADLHVVSGHSSYIIGNNLLILLKIKIDCGETMVTAASVNMEELLRDSRNYSPRT